MTPIERFLGHFPDAKRSGRGWMARCPAHDDHNPSLSISEGQNGQVLVNCFAGCPLEAILKAKDMTVRDMMPDRNPGPNETRRQSRRSSRKPTTYISARAAAKSVASQFKGTVTRLDKYSETFYIARIDFKGGKTYRPTSKNSEGWVLAAPNEKRPLFHGDRIGKNQRVFVVEGEKCVEAAETIGMVAVTSSGGAGSAAKTDWNPLAGLEVIILLDNDIAGHQFAQEVLGILSRLNPPATVKIVELPDLPEKGDIADFIEGRDSVESDDIRRCIETLAEESDSIPLPMGDGSARNEYWGPVPITELGDDEPVEWIWEQILAKRLVTVLPGVPKGGKTTLLSHLLRTMGGGGTLGTPVTPGRVMVVTEESKMLWRNRRDALGLGPYVEIWSRPFKGKPNSEEWEVFVNRVAELTAEKGFDLVVFDTLPALSPVKDENDAARVQGSLAPLHRITEAGAALLLVHHLRKSDASEGQGARGSSALHGFVDIIAELRRCAGGGHDDRRRSLVVYSRFEGLELVLELTDEGYRSLGTKAEATIADRMGVIEAILKDHEEPLGAKEVRGAWPETEPASPSERTIREALEAGFNQKRWTRAGRGVKSDPYRYSRNWNSFLAEHLPKGQERKGEIVEQEPRGEEVRRDQENGPLPGSI